MTPNKTHYIGNFPLILKRHPRARHLKLRYEAKSKTALLTLPPGLSEKKALQFAHKHHDWLQDQHQNAPAVIPLLPGNEIPFRGLDHKICHRPELPASVSREAGCLNVCGPDAAFEMRLGNWLRKQARLNITKMIDQLAFRPSLKPHRIMIRDTKSRWGSCSPTGVLSFSWRLVLAPEHVLDYVVCHEAAHLRELNHSARFWALVSDLSPAYETAEAWLKHFGPDLHRFG